MERETARWRETEAEAETKRRRQEEDGSRSLQAAQMRLQTREERLLRAQSFSRLSPLPWVLGLSSQALQGRGWCVCQSHLENTFISTPRPVRVDT